MFIVCVLQTYLHNLAPKLNIVTQKCATWHRSSATCHRRSPHATEVCKPATEACQQQPKQVTMHKAHTC